MKRKEQIRRASIEYTIRIADRCIGADAFPKIIDEINRNHAFEEGVKWADEHPYWRPSTEHPQMDEEVIALVGEYNQIYFAHIVDKRFCVDYDGWNIPDVRWWIPCPKIEED